MTSAVRVKTTLEVERKFRGLAVASLTLDAGSPPFHSLHFLGQQIFRDIYFDSGNKLSSGGLWVRKREYAGGLPLWEAKHRQGGSFRNSMFEEITDPHIIAQHVRVLTGEQGDENSNFGLGIIANLVTERKSWLADEHFKVVLDSMDFGHEVGEVELERTIDIPQHQDPKFDVDAWKRGITQDMDSQIEQFMQRYKWAFQSGEPQGKLTAYFDGLQRTRALH